MQKQTSTPTSENAFYDNLTLGLMRLLSNTPRIANVTLDKRPPCERTHVTSWEQKHNVYLPDDLKRFFLSTDGFTMHWSYLYTPDDLLRVGFFSFPQLGQITILREPVETFLTAAASTPPSSSPAIIQPQPLLTGRSKIFELSQICDLAKVCLIYETSDTNVPRIFVLVLATQRWYFLADAFAEYHRMAIAHLGLPSWELCFTPRPLPPWTEQLFRLLAPHLLERTEPRRTRHYWMPSATIGGEQLQQQPFNQLDAGIFRTAAKTTTATAKVTTSTTAAVVGGGGMRTQQRRGHY